MQKIFGGVKNRCRQKFGGNDYGVEVYNWLYGDMADCIAGKENQMEMIVRAVMRSLDKPDEDTVLGKVIDLLVSWLRSVFTVKLDEAKYMVLKLGLENIFNPVTEKIRPMVKQVLAENKHKKAE